MIELNDMEIREFPQLPAVALRTIFKRLSYHTLKECRGVCKEWNEEATAFFKHKSVLLPRLYNDGIQKGMEYCNERVWRDFFARHLEMKETAMPIVNIHLEETFQDEGMQWLKIYGRNLKSIYCTISQISVDSRFSVFFMFLSELCPNVEEIVVTLKSTFLEKIETPLKIIPSVRKIRLVAAGIDEFHDSMSLRLNLWDSPFISELVGAAVNLQCLEVETNGHASISTAVARTMLTKGSDKVNQIIWKDFINEVDLHILLHIRNEIKLEKLYLDCELPPWDSIPIIIFNLLEKHSESLKSLKFCGRLVESWEQYNDDGEDENHDNVLLVMHRQIVDILKTLGIRNPVPNLDIPVVERQRLSFTYLKVPLLPNVTSLEISDIFHLRIQRNLSSFLAWLPALKQLNLTNVSYAWDVYPLTPDEVLKQLLHRRDKDPVHNSLQEFYLDAEITEKDQIHCIVQSLPKLKKLKIQVNSDNVFCLALEQLATKLRLCELELSFRSIADMHWCNNMMTICFSMMPDLRNLQLEYQSPCGNLGNYAFRLAEEYVIDSLCRASSLRWLKLTNFSFCSTTMEETTKRLKHHCFSVIFENCSLYNPPFNVTYDPWNKYGIQ